MNRTGPATENCQPQVLLRWEVKTLYQRYMLTDEMAFFIKWGKNAVGDTCAKSALVDKFS